MKNTTLLIVLLLAAFSCKKETTQEDLCQGVTCLNGGTCVNGDCSCPAGYTGPACEQEKVPVKMRVGFITLIDFPPTTTSGAGWDVFDGPDVYIEIRQGNTVIFSSGFIEDLSGGNTYTANVEFSNPQATYNISVLDYDDGLSADDFMGGINFTPYKPGQNFPKTFQITCSGCAVSFSFSSAVYTH